jgi:hypothetical protein
MYKGHSSMHTHRLHSETDDCVLFFLFITSGNLRTRMQSDGLWCGC